MIIGNGFFKPNISTMVGDLYPQGDARRDGAFIIFYMGINIGAFLAPLVCSTLGEDPAYGWRVGFFAAGIGMLLSVIIQLAFAQRYIGDVGRRAGGPALARAWRAARRQPLTQIERDRLRVDLRDLHVRRDLLGDVRAGRRPDEPVRRQVHRPAGGILPGADRLVPVAESALHRAARHPVLDALEQARRERQESADAGQDVPRPRAGRARIRLPRDRRIRDAADRRHEVQHDLAGARLSLPHDRRALHQPGRPLDGHQARAAAARLADDGRLVPGELRSATRSPATSARSPRTWANTPGW